VCAAGYSNSIGYQCTQCKHNTNAAIYSTLAVVLLLFILVCIYAVLELIGVDDAPHGLLNIVHCGFMKKLARLTWGKLRIPIVAYQIVTQFIGVTGLPLPNIYHKFLSWIDVSNLNLGWLLSLGCLARVNFYQKLLITTLSPFIIVAALACTYATVRYRNTVQAVTAASSQRALERHYSAFLTLTFLIYSTVSTTVFQTFACDCINDYATIKTSYLRADYSIQCYTQKHTLYRVYAGIMVFIYPIGWLLARTYTYTHILGLVLYT
jgi:hypothetical protein